MRYVEDNGLPYRIDFSNYDKNFLRNRIRWELLPLLKERFNPRVVEGLCRLAEAVWEDNQYWEEEVGRLFLSITEPGGDAALRVLVDRLAALPGALKRRLVYRLLISAGGRRVSWADVDRVLDLCSKPGSVKRVRVSGGIWVRRSYDFLEFGCEPRATEGFCYQLPVPGRIFVPEMGAEVEAKIIEAGDVTIKENPYQAVFDLERVKTPLFIRSRRPGDRFRPQGLGGTKKLKDYLIDAKIPAGLRDRIGLLASAEEIYWVIGYRKDERAAVTERTRDILLIEVKMRR